ASLGGELRHDALSPARFGRSHGVQELGTGAGGLGNQVPSLVPPVRGHLTAGRGGIAPGADRLQKHLVRRDAYVKDHGAGAVIGVEPVVGGFQNHSGGGRDRLVAGAADLEVDLVLPLELDLLVVDPPREVNVAIGSHQNGRIEAMVFAGVNLRGHG